MLDRERPAISWIDLLWLLFLGGLAALPPVDEIHKQLILLWIVIVQLFEGWAIKRLPKRGPTYSVIVKILLATLLLDHTGGLGINSNYYPIFFLPVVSAAIYFGPLATLAWTAAASLGYLSLLLPVLQDYELESTGLSILAIRILFFFVAAILVNRFAVENRRQVERLQVLSGKLEETNQQLRRAEADARRAERLAALGQLSAGLAHEIRNPLAVIKGSAEMLNRKVAESEPLAAELAGYISTEVNRINALVVRFLDFARPSKLDLQPEQVSELVDEALEISAATFPNAKVNIIREYVPGAPSILADRQLCVQVFVNLITNAYQAIGEQQGTLRLSIFRETSNGAPGVGVIVGDSGAGVPADAREQIFNPFFTSKKDGVGLGLSIVAKIVDDHRGTIRLENGAGNAAGNGARFHVFFPEVAPA